jgi:hypothetical protein
LKVALFDTMMQAAEELDVTESVKNVTVQIDGWSLE